MLYVPLQFRAYENQGLLDTCAIQSAMSENELRRILQAHPAAQLEKYSAPDFKVQIANGSIVLSGNKSSFDSLSEKKCSKKHL